MHHHSLTAIPTLLLAVVITFGLGVTASGDPPQGLEGALALEEAVINAIARSEESVVAIARVRRGVEAPRDPLNFTPHEGGLPGAFRRADPTSIDYIPAEYGTGVVIDRRGLILTNYHLLGDVDSCDYYVTTSNRVVYPATVTAADPWSDLAILHIDSENLSPISLGEGGELQKGRIVISLGNPYAIARDGEVSAGWGIISNIRRKAALSQEAAQNEGRPTMHHYGTLLQVDVRLNLGTSGGPLLDLEGNMVGLSTSLAALPGHEGGGIGYAVPVDASFRHIVNLLKEGRALEYGFLGIAPEALTLQERAGGMHGVRVRQIVPGSPAAKSDLTVGAIITHIQGDPIHDPDALILRVGQESVDSVIMLSTINEGERNRVPVTLSKRYVSNSRAPICLEPLSTWRGLQIDYATAIPQFSQQSGNIDPDGCVAVIDVAHDSPAWRAGLRPGLFISHIGNQRVERPADFYAAVEAKEGMDTVLQLTTRVVGNSIVTIAP